MPAFLATYLICLAPALTLAAEKPDHSLLAQVPDWSSADLEFFLHGSMSTEFVPEAVLRAFMRAYPDLYPTQDFSHLGALADPEFGWPVGFTHAQVPHLGGLNAVGVNCASCHVGEIAAPRGGAGVRLLGMTAQFDVEAFFGTVVVSTFRTADPANMKRFLAAYLAENDAACGEAGQELLRREWQKQEHKILDAISANPTGGKEVKPEALLNQIRPEELALDSKQLETGADLAALSRSMLKLCHNIRAALHVPDQPPPASPPNGPGRNDPWRLLSYSLLGLVTEPAPVKFGIVWNEDQRVWVHVDGNTRSPIVRNLAASLGLGAPLIGHRGVLDFAAVQRHTALSQSIRPPRYPWAIDTAAAGRGAKTYAARCASCHDAPDSSRLYPLSEIGTDPNRATIFTPQVAALFNKFFDELQVPGYSPPTPAPLRSTGQYWAPGLAGVWARPPYLHNGSVRTMQELLAAPAARAKSFHRGSRTYDSEQMGYVDAGPYLVDTKAAGSSNSGHNYGADLSADDKRALVEYLKTL